MTTLRVPMVVYLVAATNLVWAIEFPEPNVIQGHSKAVTTLVWSVDGKSLATASDDRSVKVWEPATGKQTASLSDVARDGYGGPVVAFNADLDVMAVNYWGEITIRSLPAGKQLLKIDPILDRANSTFRPDVYAMAFSPDGKLLATAGSVAAQGLPGGIVIVWNTQNGNIVKQFDKLSTAAGAVVFSPDGKLVAAGTNGVGGELPQAGQVLVWDAETGKVLHNFNVKQKVEYGEWASAGDVAFSPDGNRVAATVTAGSRSAPAGLIIPDTGASVRIWDLKTDKVTQPVKDLKSSLKRIVFSSDGKRLATASSDRFVRVWDIQTAKELAVLRCSDEVGVVAFSPDGHSLAAGSNDGSLRIWRSE